MENPGHMKNPSVSKSIRLPFEMWENIQNLVEIGTFEDFSHAIRVLAEGGMQLMKIKDTINDPEKISQITNEWSSKINEDEILDWAKNLSDSQLQAVDMLIGMEKEKRI